MRAHLHRGSHLWRDVRAHLALLGVLVVLLAAISFTGSSRAPFSSIEVEFADASPSGLSIVPASCPSQPHVSGGALVNGGTGTECDCTGPNCQPIVNDPRGTAGCYLSASPYNTNAGSPVNLYWYALDPYGGSLAAQGYSSQYIRGTITSTLQMNIGTPDYNMYLPQTIANVQGMSGSATAYAAGTTLYQLTGNHYIVYNGAEYVVGPVACDALVTSTFNCPSGYSLSNGQCIPPNPPQCPAGYVMQNGQCVPTGGGQQCPAGYALVGGQCVPPTLNCPSGYVQQGAQCVVLTCPTGFQVQGNQCVAIQCPAGWTLSGNTCMPPPSINFVPFTGSHPTLGSFQASGHLEVKPTLVRRGDTVRVYWNVENTDGCTVRGTNGDSWSDTFSGASGRQSSPITERTIYTLDCEGLTGAEPPSVAESKTVNIIPVFDEQ